MTDILTLWVFKSTQLIQINSRKLSAMALVAKIAAITALFAVVPISAKPLNPHTYQTNISFNQAQPLAMLVTQKPVAIAMGESEYAKTEREKAAATALAQAQAYAKALASARVSSSDVSYSDPSDFDQIYKQAGMQFGIPWQLIKAVHYVESGCSGSTSKRSFAGAQGPMQFMSGTWHHYGVDGNGDGVTDVNNVVDAIFGAANLLAQSGAAEGNIDGALFNYNHSTSYVNKVKEVAYSIGM